MYLCGRCLCVCVSEWLCVRVRVCGFVFVSVWMCMCVRMCVRVCGCVCGCTLLVGMCVCVRVN